MRAKPIALGALVAAVIGVALTGFARSPATRLSFDEDVSADVGSAADPTGDSLAGGRAHVEIVGRAKSAAKGRVTGDVRHHGLPSAAHVALYEVAKADAFTDPSWAVTTEYLMPTEEFLTASPSAAVEAGADGTFEFADVAAGTYDVVARAASGAVASTRAVIPCDAAIVSAHLELMGGGSEQLRGHVTHVDGRPFKGYVCPCAAVDQSGSFPRGATPVPLDDDGRFTLAGLDRGPTTVLVFVPGIFAARSHVVILPSSQTMEIVIDAATHEVAGRVVADKDGQPIAGATVLTTLWSPSGLQYLESRAITDGDGRFRVLALAGRTYYLVKASGYASVGSQRWLPEGDGFEFRLVKSGRITGHVTSKVDGTPVEGVPIYVIDGRDHPGPHAVSKADGRYEIADVYPGDVFVVAYGTGFIVEGFSKANGRYNPLAVALDPGGIATVDLIVSRAARATGKVVDAAGKAVAGAQVAWTRRLPGDNEDSLLGFLSATQTVATQADGMFAFDTLAPGYAYDFHAVAADMSEGTSERIRAEPDHLNVVEIKLGPARFAQVLVRERDGGPVPGVGVSAWGRTGDFWRSYSGATSDSNGIARIGPIAPGAVTFGASSEGYSADDTEEIGGPDGNTDAINVELVVTRTHVLAGIVRYADATPFVGGTVRVDGPSGRSQAEIGEDGGFRFDGLLEGAYELRVQLDSDSDPLETISVKAGDENVRVVVKSKKKERLVVRVVDENGKFVGHAAYRLFQRWDNNSDHDDGTLEEGRLQLALPRHEWFLFVFGARASGGGPAALGPAVIGPFPPETVAAEVRLPPERRIEGVVEAPDGHGVRGVRVSALFKNVAKPFEHMDLEASSARTDERGRFGLGGLGTGTYELRVAVGGVYGAIEPVEAKAGATDVVLTLGVGDVVEPTVLDADAKPVAGAYVKVSTNEVVAEADTDGEGHAVLEGLDSKKTYTLEIQPPRLRDDVLEFTQKDWTPSSKPLKLVRGLKLSGVVRDLDGQPVADASVNVRYANDADYGVTTLANGTFEFRRMPAGLVSVSATVDGPPKRGGRAVKAIVGASDVIVVLDAASTLAVHVTTTRPIPDDMYFRLREEGAGDEDWEPIGADGRATFAALRPGAVYVVSADLAFEGGARLVGVAKGVKGDSRTLELKLLEGRRVTGRVRAPAGTRNIEVQATTEGEGRSASVDEDGRFIVEGLFAGPCELIASGKGPGGEALEAKATVEAGGAVELELRPTK